MKKSAISILFFILNTYPCYAEYNGNEVQIIDESDAQNEIQTIKNNIFQYNFDYLKESFKQEIIKIEAENKASNNIKLSQLELGISASKLKYKMLLEDIIKSNKSEIIKSEAYFRLALFQYDEDKNKDKEAIELVEKGLTYLVKGSNSIDLYVKMNFFLGELYLIKENYKKSSFNFQNILDYVNTTELNQLYADEKIRSLIGLGDCEFLQSNFELASKYYKKSYDNLKIASNFPIDKYTNTEELINLRIILSDYRSGNYKNALTVLKNYSSKKNLGISSVDNSMLKYLVKFGGISLFELKNRNDFTELSNEKKYGNFGKEIILYSFPLFREAGESKIIDSIAYDIKNDFYNSNKHYLFVRNWLEIKNSLENKEKFYALCYEVIQEISKNSLWSGKFILNDKQNQIRKSIILKYSLNSANYFYKKGLQSNSKSDFYKSAEIYKSRIDEDDIIDNKGILYQKYADSLLMAKEESQALLAVDKSLQYHLEDEYLKSGLFLRIKITRSITSNSKNTKAENYAQYENAVDTYFAYFPQERNAQNSLYESAKRAEIMGDFNNAKKRYERLLSSLQKNRSKNLDTEKNKVVQSLSELLLKIKNNYKDNIQSTVELEKYLSQFKSNKDSIKIVQLTNSQMAMNYSKELNKEGKLEDSAKFLSTWAEINNKNPDSSRLYLESIKQFAQLQAWKKVLNLSDNFINIYKNDERLYEVYFWKGKSLENILIFPTAADYYVKSANVHEKFPSFQNKIDALNRAAFIYKSLNSNSNLASTLEKKSILQKLNKENPIKIALTQFESAQIFFKIKEWKKASELYSLVYNNKNSTNKLKIESKLSQLLINLQGNYRYISAVDQNIKLYLKSQNNIQKNFIEDTIIFLNEYEGNNIETLNNSFHIYKKISYLEKINSILNRLIMRTSLLDSKKLPQNIIVNSYILIGKISNLLSENYTNLYFSGKKDSLYLKNSENYHTQAKKYFSLALKNSQKDELIQFEIKKTAQRYFKIPDHIPIQFALKNEITNKTLLSMLNSNIEKNSLAAQSIDDLSKGEFNTVVSKINSFLDGEKKRNSHLNHIDVNSKPMREIYFLLAFSYMEMGEKEKAQKILDELILSSEKWEPAYLLLYKFYSNQNALSLARKIATKAMDKLENPSEKIILNYALSELALGTALQTKTLLQKFHMSFPNNPDILNLMGVFFLKNNDIIESCKNFKQSYELGSNDSPAPAYNHLACLILSQDFENAKKVLQISLQKFNHYAGFYYLGGELEKAKGRSITAQKYWENFLKLAESSDSKLLYVQSGLAKLTLENNLSEDKESILK